MKKVQLLVIFVMLLGAVVLVLPAAAAYPQSLELVADMTLTSADSAAGPFTLYYDGAEIDSGWATETFFQAGGLNMGTVHGIKTLDGADGTFTIRFDAQSVPVAPGQFLASGRWVIVSGTGAYANLYGEGQVSTTLDVATVPPSLHAEYSGQGHFEP